jgi:hypothetical protein
MVNHLVVRFGSFPFAVQNSFILRLEKGLFDRRKVIIAIIIVVVVVSGKDTWLVRNVSLC